MGSYVPLPRRALGGRRVTRAGRTPVQRRYREPVVRSSTADIGARLLAGGLVRQARRPGNGQRSILSLTPDAEQRLRQITPKVAAVQRDLLSPLDPADAAAFPEWLAYVAFLGYPPHNGG